MAFKGYVKVVEEIEGRDPRAGGLNCKMPSLARQSEQEGCDINIMLRRYGVIPVPAPSANVGLYGDFSEVGDYLDAQMRLKTAREQFESLPSQVRERFRNNPAEFLTFIADKSNKAQAQAWGLLKDVDKPVLDAVEKTGDGDKSSTKGSTS